MSIAHVKPRNELVTCPYNSSHRIENGRLPIHLIKCRKNHDSSQFQACPFNASHVVPLAEKSHHISVCPDRAVAERHLINKLYPNLTTLDQELLTELEVPQSSENWEIEVGLVAAPGYDPTKRTSEQAFHNPAVFSAMTRSQKKQFRQSQNNQGLQSQFSCNGDDVDALITGPLRQLRLPREDGQAAQSMQVLGGFTDATSSTAVSRLSSNRTCDSKVLGGQNLITVSKGRGSYKFPATLRPGPSAPGLGAVNEALKSKMRSGSGDSLPKADLQQSSASVSDNLSSTSDESDGVPIKKLRNRLQKKIKQIDVLLELQGNGATLNKEELEKVAKKAEILRVLEFLPQK